MHELVTPFKKQLAQLQALNAVGKMSDTQYQQERSDVERQLLDVVLSDSPSAQVSLSTKPSGRLMVVLAVLVLVVAAAGYWLVGQPTQDNPADGLDGPRHATTPVQMGEMTEKLAQRLKNFPDDAEGWAMLARSYSVLGRNADALDAYSHAASLLKDDPSLLADFADALGVQNKHSLTGDPMRLIERALKIDPNNIKALLLAGTEAFDRKDYAGALKYWEKVRDTGPADHPLVQRIGGSIDEARSLLGVPIAQPEKAAKPKAKVDAKANPKASITGVVSLSPALLKQVEPMDTVFIFAKAGGNARMPLVAERKQVKDLPYAFTLDDSKALSPNLLLSSAEQVVISAKISKSGDAISRAGDFTGQTGPVKLGATGVRVEINDPVKP